MLRHSLAAFTLAILSATLGGVTGTTTAAHAGRAEARAARRETELASALATARDERTRLVAAVALGKMGGPRAAAALTGALRDPSARVRGVAATALGHMAADVGPSTRAALGALSRDPVLDVRERARVALAALDGPVQASAPITPASGFVVPKEAPRRSGNGATGVVVRAGSSGRARPSHGLTLVRALRAELARQPGIVLDAPAADRAFVIDGVITRLDRVMGRPWVEVTAEVKLTVSTGDGRIVGMVSGRATVQTPRSHYRPTMDASLETDALENAVRGANQNVLASMGMGRKLALR